MIGQSGKNGRRNFRRRLRKESTDAERALWRVLRERQICGLRFRRQHDFRTYTLDFVCLERKLVVEVDGGQHSLQAEYDEKRTQDLRDAGFHIVRFWDNDVLTDIDAVKQRLFEILLQLQPHPHPHPPLEGEGDPTNVPTH